MTGVTGDRGGIDRLRVEQMVVAAAKPLSRLFFLVITAAPLAYMVAVSFKPISAVLADPANPLPSWDDVRSLASYRSVFAGRENGGQGFLRFMRNSLVVSAVTVVTTLAVGTLSAYAAARFQFFGKRAVSFGILLVYLFPPLVIAIPLFVLFSQIQLRGSLMALMIVYLAQTLPIAMYMMRNYFESIPIDVEEAGLMDGLSHLGVLRRITLPLSAPALAATGLYVFMIAWNEFLFALLFVQSEPNLWTVSLGIHQLDSTEVPRTVLMAGSVAISLPVIVVFFLAERFMTDGLTAGSVKG